MDEAFMDKLMLLVQSVKITLHPKDSDARIPESGSVLLSSHSRKVMYGTVEAFRRYEVYLLLRLQFTCIVLCLLYTPVDIINDARNLPL